MRYLIDTNIISELIKSQPDKNVVHLFGQIDESKLYISVITIGEIKFGIEKVQDSRKKEKLTWFDLELPNRFENRIIDIDTESMLKWGTISWQLKKTGKPMPIMDSLIAATCLAKDFALITRNEKDFAYLPIEIVNPFNTI